jgi:hypothetical protein
MHARNHMQTRHLGGRRVSAKLQTIDEGSDSRNILEKTRGIQAASKRRIGRVFASAPCSSAACVLFSPQC